MGEHQEIETAATIKCDFESVFIISDSITYIAGNDSVKYTL